MPNKDIILSSLEALKTHTPKQEIILGFDGFIDQIIHLVDERQDAKNYSRLNEMTHLAKKIDLASGKSCNIEMKLIETKLGGNAPIMANALLSQGFEINYFGALGKDKTHTIFDEFVSKCKKVISIADPAVTEALEFHDGKIMMGRLEPLDDVNWENLQSKISESDLDNILNNCSLVACVNWTMMPYMNSIYEGLTKHFAKTKNRKLVFIDLVDPRKRTAEDLSNALKLLAAMQEHADVILGLNEDESIQVAELLAVNKNDLCERANAILNSLKLKYVVIHPTKGACIATEKESFYYDGPYTPTPKLTTGAGDNFNSGFCNALLSGLNPEQAIITGVSTSGYYVRNCHSPDRKELLEFMQTWANADGKDI